MELQLPRAKNWTANWAHKKGKNSKKKEQQEIFKFSAEYHSTYIIYDQPRTRAI